MLRVYGGHLIMTIATQTHESNRPAAEHWMLSLGALREPRGGFCLEGTDHDPGTEAKVSQDPQEEDANRTTQSIPQITTSRRLGEMRRRMATADEGDRVGFWDKATERMKPK